MLRKGDPHPSVPGSIPRLGGWGICIQIDCMKCESE